MSANLPTNPPPDQNSESDDWRSYPHKLIVWSLLAIAIGIRIYHFLRNPPVWCDELWLLHNITGLSFAEQLGPLKDVQAAPPLFLWVERVIFLGFGDNIYMLRLLPLLASCGTVFLLFHLGRYCCRAAVLPWALLLLGCSNQILSYTFEAKPYMVDSFIALAIPALFIYTMRWRLEWRLALFVPLAPVVIFLSYPGCFVCGALLVALLGPLWNDRRLWPAWLGYGLLVLSTFASFYLLVSGPVRAQRTAALDACWVDHPDLRHPWNVPFWSLDAFCRLLEHFWRPTGFVFLLPTVIGVICLWRRKRRTELVLLGLPTLLAMMASWTGAYNFESRLILFGAAPLALIIGAGIVEIVGWFQLQLDRTKSSGSAWKRAGLTAGFAVFVVLLLAPLGTTLYYLVAPLPRLTKETWPETQHSQQSGEAPNDGGA